VDRALADDAAAAASSALPPALRARIVAAAFPAAAPAPRGRILDFALRFAAVAAVVVAAVWVSPVPVQAAELAPPSLPDLRRVIADGIDLPSLDWVKVPPLPQAQADDTDFGVVAAALGGLAAILLAGGFALRRR
jgi:hypothetical protein